jgi:glyoxylate/hydroxypyruvate reductase A
MTRARRPVHLLVYAPDDADAFARLIRAPRRSVVRHVCHTPEEAAAAVEEAEVIYAWGFPTELLPRAKRLRWVQGMGAGVDAFLQPGLLPAGVVVTRTIGAHGPWMAEYVVGHLLARLLDLGRVRADQEARRWPMYFPDRLHGKTLGLVGIGAIGQAIARAARGLGMRVVGLGRARRRAPFVDRVYPRRGLRAMLGACDAVVVVVPLTPETRGMIGAAEFRAMARRPWFVSIGRGPVVDEPALITALREGRLAGAILDVFEREPLPPDSPLWTMPNVVVTPHMAGPTYPDDVVPTFNENLRRYLAGARLRNVVDRRRGY